MIRELTPELAEIAKKELDENPKRLNDDLQHLKDWISKQPHLIARTDDQWLVGVLRGCKFSLEKVKQKLDLFYTLRTAAADVTLRMRPSDAKFLDFFRIGTVVILPNGNDSALYHRYIMLRPGLYDPSKNSVADVICVLYYLVQIIVIDDDIATVKGTKIITDYTGVTFAHFAQATPSLLKKMIAVCQKTLPLRLKGNHNVNVPTGIEAIFALVKGLIGDKANERLKIHKTNADLLQYVPKEIIPEEYGGVAGPVDKITEQWAKKIIEYKSWLAQEEQFGTDESKRVGVPKTDMFDDGVQGSFRKLDID